MYGLAQYGQDTYGDEDVSLFGLPSEAELVSPAMEFTTGMEPGVHMAGAAVLSDTIHASESEVHSSSNISQQYANLTGFIKPYLYDQLLYDERIFEEQGSLFAIDAADYGVSTVDCSAPPMVPDMLSGGFNFPADFAGSLGSTSEEITHAVAYFLDEVTVAVPRVAERESDHDDSTQYNNTVAPISVFDAVESYTYVPPIYRHDMPASIPGLREAPYIDSQKWAMEFGADQFRVFELPLDKIVIPSGDPTGLNGVFYRDKGTTESMMYGHEHTYDTRGGVYLGIVNWQAMFLDRSRMAYPIEDIAFSSLACGLPAIEHEAEWMHKLFDIPVPDIMWPAPGPAAAGAETREAAQYTDIVYASREAMFANLLLPSTTGGHSEVHGEFGWLELGVAFPSVDAFTFHVEHTEMDTVVPLVMFEAHETLQIGEAEFFAESDMPLAKFIDAIATFDKIEINPVAPAYTGEASSWEPIGIATFSDDSRVPLPADAISWPTTEEAVIAPMADIVANVAPFGLGLGHGNTFAVWAQSLVFPEAGCEDGWFTPFIDNTLHELPLAEADFKAYNELPLLEGHIGLIIDLPADRFPGHFIEPHVIEVGIAEAMTACVSGAPELPGTMAPIPFIYQFQFLADPWTYAEPVFVGDGVFDCTHSTAMHPAEVLPEFDGVSSAVSSPDIIEVHLPSVATGEFYCKPHQPLPAEIMTEPDYVYESLSYVRVDSHHTLSVNFADSAATGFHSCDQGTGLILGGFIIDEPLLMAQNAERTTISIVDVSVAEVSCTPNGCWSWGYILDAYAAINILPRPLWYEYIIEYDYENTDPRDMAFIF